MIASEGRAFPVETRYVGRDTRPIEPQIADTIVRAMRADAGSLLAFLPGAAEIRRTKTLLEGRTEPSTDVVALYGALTGDEQDRAIAPALPGRRKIVLATSIAETSITIEGVRMVVDSGLARVPRYEPDVGVTRLETVRFSRAAADQRRGRAGRTEPGVCYRLWDEPQTAALEPFARPEILPRIYRPLRSTLPPGAAARTSSPSSIRRRKARLPRPRRCCVSSAPSTVTAASPPRASCCGACRCRHGSGAWWSTPARKVTPCPPRKSPPSSANAASAATMSTCANVSMRCAATARRAPAMPAPWRNAGQRYNSLPTRRRGIEGRPYSRSPTPSASPRTVAARRARSCSSTAAALPSTRLPAAREPFLAVAELAGTAAQGRILSAAPITLAEIEQRFSDRIDTRKEIAFDAASASLRGRRSRRLGAIALSDQPTPIIADDDTAQKLAAGIASLGMHRLPWTKSLQQWRDRVMFLRTSEGEEWPDLSDTALAQSVNAWLAPGARRPKPRSATSPPMN